MNVIFYGTSSDKKSVNKQLTEIYSDSIVLKDNNSLTDVVIDAVIFDNWQQVNYVYVDSLRRYYYAKPEPLIGNTIRFKCHVDVLMSNRESILNLNALINRSSSSNEYLVDNEQALLNYKTQHIINFPTNMAFNNSLTYILTVAGGGVN